MVLQTKQGLMHDARDSDKEQQGNVDISPGAVSGIATLGSTWASAPLN